MIFCYFGRVRLPSETPKTTTSAKNRTERCTCCFPCAQQRVLQSRQLLFSPSTSNMLTDATLMKSSDEKLDHTSDEAARPQSQDPELLVDSEEEQRLVRKLDRRILPITCLLYLFACTSILQCITALAPLTSPSLPLTCSFGPVKHWKCTVAGPPRRHNRRR